MGGSARNLTRRVGAAGWICWTFYNIQSRFAHSIFSHFLPSHIQVCKEFIRPPYFANCLCTLRRRQKRSWPHEMKMSQSHAEFVHQASLLARAMQSQRGKHRGPTWFEDEQVAFRMDCFWFQGSSCRRIAHSRLHIEVLWGRILFTPTIGGKQQKTQTSWIFTSFLFCWLSSLGHDMRSEWNMKQ